MVKLTEQLIRQRSEHNEGVLSTMKEITLHQFDLERIEPVLQQLCPQLEIVFLQNNQIGKIENLSRLKELRYLNMAINEVTRVEGLDKCEFLHKLDLTVNYVDDLFSLESLKGNRHLRELHMVGNPCTQLEGYRLFVVGTLPQLQVLDGKEVLQSERILARQQYEEIAAKLRVVYADPERIKQQLADKETRIKMYKEIQEKKEQAEAEKNAGRKPKEAKEPAPLRMKEDGTMMQRNEGDWDFELRDAPAEIVLDVACGKYLDTSQIDVDLQPRYIKITIKGKLLVLNLPEEVHPDQSKCQRSQLTGHLVVTMRKVNAVDPLPAPAAAAKKKLVPAEKPKDNSLLDDDLKSKLSLGDVGNIVKQPASKAEPVVPFGQPVVTALPKKMVQVVGEDDTHSPANPDVSASVAADDDMPPLEDVYR